MCALTVCLAPRTRTDVAIPWHNCDLSTHALRLWQQKPCKTASGSYYCECTLVWILQNLGIYNTRDGLEHGDGSQRQVRSGGQVYYAASQPIFSNPACDLLTPTKTMSAVSSAQTSQAQRHAQPRLPNVLSSACPLRKDLVRLKHVIFFTSCD